MGCIEAKPKDAERVAYTKNRIKPLRTTITPRSPSGNPQTPTPVSPNASTKSPISAALSTTLFTPSSASIASASFGTDLSSPRNGDTSRAKTLPLSSPASGRVRAATPRRRTVITEVANESNNTPTVYVTQPRRVQQEAESARSKTARESDVMFHEISTHASTIEETLSVTKRAVNAFMASELFLADANITTESKIDYIERDIDQIERLEQTLSECALIASGVGDVDTRATIAILEAKLKQRHTKLTNSLYRLKNTTLSNRST